MLHWFVWFPEFAEFSESSVLFGKNSNKSLWFRIRVSKTTFAIYIQTKKRCFKTILPHRRPVFTPVFQRATENINTWNQLESNVAWKKGNTSSGVDYVISSTCHSHSGLHYSRIHAESTLRKKHSSFILQYPEKLPSRIDQMPVLLFPLRHAWSN